ncbi:hypothetical protein F4861DRAFT_200007 [Xylaria intraflava]|nr:hypothetical protein F4861DRAFT_200007 [Xylaria intraflava]
MTPRALFRGFTAHNHAFYLTKTGRTRSQIVPSSRFFSAEAISHSSNLVQVYISRATDPYLNLSIEHFLLQKSHKDSVVLFLYTNRPCIVIGRNQNPWVEVNLGLVNQSGVLKQQRQGSRGSKSVGIENEDGNAATTYLEEVEQGGDDVLLVRRRSGGGTVFHDTGNVNYGVIYPRASFHRDKYAEMVARALRGLKKIPHDVRVNGRHDIVLDISRTSGEQDTNGDVETYKISGSAYKLTRTRALHHGTCLLSSPHLPFLSQLLTSPAAPYIRARGVESVRSPVRNVGISNTEFENTVVGEFKTMHEGARPDIKVEVLAAADVEQIPEIQAGVAQLRSQDWIYAQTPQFSFSSHSSADDPRPRPDLPADLLSSFFPTTDHADAAPLGLQMTVRHAQITEVVTPSAKSQVAKDMTTRDSERSSLKDSLHGLYLHHIDDWRKYTGSDKESVGRWLNGLFGVSGEGNM